MYYHHIRSCSYILCGCFTSSNFTDEISAARAELDCLERHENELLKQLVDTRAAALAQRRRLGDLVRRGKPPINRLPVESLLQIIGLAICAPSDGLSEDHINRIRRKGELAGVSRHWRNLIFGCPNLWTEITLVQVLPPSVVRMHAIRSRTCLIDVHIGAWYTDSNKFRYLGEMLDAVVACVSRWRTFTVQGSYCQAVFSLIFRRIDGLCFPCLSSVDIPAELFPGSGPQAGYQRSLQPQNIPRLKHAVLHTYKDDFDLPLELETLSLTVPNYYGEPRTSQSTIPSSSRCRH